MRHRTRRQSLKHQGPRENWVPVIGYQRLYEISNLGNLRRLTSRKGSCAGTLVRYAKSKGYLRVPLWKDGRPKDFRVNRLVCLHFHRMPSHLPPSGKWEACHKNGLAQDNRAENLYWGTHTDNMRDCVRHGRSPKGERHGLTRLTNEMVRSIRRLEDSGVTQRTIAGQFRVSQSSVHRIVSRQLWTHI